MNYHNHVRNLTPPTKAPVWWVTLPSCYPVNPLQWARSLPWPPGWEVVATYQSQEWDRNRRGYILTTKIRLELDPFWWRANLPLLPGQRIMVWLEEAIERMETSYTFDGRVRASRTLVNRLALVRAWAEHADREEVERFAADVGILVEKANNLLTSLTVEL